MTEQCEHENEIIIVVYKCSKCGQITQNYIPKGQFATTLSNVRQGKVDKLTAIKDSQLTDEQRALLESVETCHHNTGEYRECCGGVIRWVCTDCGRKFPEGLKPAHAVEDMK